MWGRTPRYSDYAPGIDHSTVDCVSDPAALKFRGDLPNGHYDVASCVGNFTLPLTHLSLKVNEQLVRDARSTGRRRWSA